MKERPILMAAPMVRVTLADIKTMTRRAAKFKPLRPGLNLGFSGLQAHRFESADGPLWVLMSQGAGGCWEERTEWLRCPYGNVGDRLWVREAWRSGKIADRFPPSELLPHVVWYEADGTAPEACDGKFRQSMHMPRWASRITLEITGVRVERLQAISEADAEAEGISYDPGEGGVYHIRGLAACCDDDAVGSFRRLWQSINGADSWGANPWVWVVEFKRVTE